MKKGFKSLLFLVLMLAIVPCVKAATASVSLNGNNSIKVGQTTTIYVRINASSSFRGVYLPFSVSGNISLVSNVATGGIEQKEIRDNKASLYTSGAIASGTNIYAITVKGTAEGTGTVSVSGVEVSVNALDDVETAVAGSSSITITVNPLKTAEEIAAEREAAERAAAERAAAEKAAAEKAKAEAEEKAKAEEEAKKKAEEEAEADKKALNKAKLLVAAAEKSLLRDDYNAALKAVNALKDSDEKTALLERLEKLKFDIAVHEACANCNSEVRVEKEIDTSGSTKWIVLSIVLLLLAITEFIYIIVNRKKNEI